MRFYPCQVKYRLNTNFKMEIIVMILEFIKNVLLLTTSQLISIFGVFFFFGIILYFLARFTRTTFVKSIGYKFDVYFTGWLGTPVHELGHAFFCIPFGHKITEIKLFSPDSKDGSLGYVNHAYKPNNIWHKIGNFFIGFGPILFGSLVLYILIKYLVPENTQIIELIASQKANFDSLAGVGNQFVNMYHAGTNIFTLLFTPGNISSWQFWLFIYVALCISSHMELSPPDIKGLWSGLITIIVLFLILNSIGVFFGVDISVYTHKISNYSYMTSGIFSFAVFISALFFIVSYLLLNVYALIRYRKVFLPF